MIQLVSININICRRLEYCYLFQSRRKMTNYAQQLLKGGDVLTNLKKIVIYSNHAYDNI